MCAAVPLDPLEMRGSREASDRGGVEENPHPLGNAAIGSREVPERECFSRARNSPRPRPPRLGHRTAAQPEPARLRQQ